MPVHCKYSFFNLPSHTSLKKQHSQNIYWDDVNVVLAGMMFNSLTTEKQTTKKFLSANFKKMLSPSYIILRIQRLEGKQCRSR